MQTEKYREERISNIVDLKEELESFHHRGKFQRSHFFLKIRTKKIVEDGTEKVSRTYHSEKQLSRPLPFATVCHFSRSPSSRNYAPFPLISALLSRTFTNRAFPSVYNAPLRAPYKSMHTHIHGCSFLFVNGVVPPQCPPYSISWTRSSTSPFLSLAEPPSLPSLFPESTTKQLVKRARGKLNKPRFQKINATTPSKGKR